MSKTAEQVEIGYANKSDASQLLNLIQRCYRGESSRVGWTHEADYLEGNRTTYDQLVKDMSTPGVQFIKVASKSSNEIIGCVYTELKGDLMYVGMLCVDPFLQSRGLGKQLMQSAENLAVQNECSRIQMQVIYLREKLIAWYKQLGYNKTGKTVPFPTESDIYGSPKLPLEFVVVEKSLNGKR